jgi:phosphatidylglycerophosphate synthase
VRRVSGFRSLRPQRAGEVGAALYVAAGLLWLATAKVPGAGAYVAPLLALGFVQTWLPGLANQVTFARAYLALPALAYALQPNGLGGLASTVAIAGATDLLDGTLARRLGQVTQFGGGLDPVVDGVFFGATAFGLAAGGAYPWWIFGVVAGRYALPALVGGLLVLLDRPVALRHTFFGQVSTALIGVLLGWVALWRGLGLDPGRVVGAAEVVIPVAAALTFANLAWVSRVSFQRPR